MTKTLRHIFKWRPCAIHMSAVIMERNYKYICNKYPKCQIIDTAIANVVKKINKSDKKGILMMRLILYLMENCV